MNTLTARPRIAREPVPQTESRTFYVVTGILTLAMLALACCSVVCLVQVIRLTA